ncbi:MAG: sigma factor-like helix-turn-helix DNA-binding protein [Verrucomicrobiota bacterium]
MRACGHARGNGHRFGLTDERIRQLQNGALAKLRKTLD